MDIIEAISLIKEIYNFKLLSYLEYDEFFVVFPNPNGEYDEGVFVVDKKTKEVTESSIFILNCNSEEFRSDTRQPIKIKDKRCFLSKVIKR